MRRPRTWFTLLGSVVACLVPAAAANAAQPASTGAPERPALNVFAAASLTNVLGELSPTWEKQSGVKVKHSFAASSVLARQIEAGGQADVFVSADIEWMDYLQARKLIDERSRRDLAGNRLVLIAPADSRMDLAIAPGFPLRTSLGVDGRLAMADPDTVPAGRYGRMALVALGVWDGLAPRIARADNVRGAMMFVARGEAPLGIVYTTDALAEKKVRIVDTFPDGTHPRITYPAAATRGAGAHSAAYLAFLSGREATPVWKKHGFLEVTR